MTVVGFSFTKLMAEKKKPVKGQINVSNNVSVKNVSEAKFGLDPKKSSLKLEFVYTANYNPEVGKIELFGEIIILVEKKESEDILKKWKKDKKIPAEFAKDVMNTLLSKCNIQAVIMSKDINLPAPIPMPKMK